MEELSVVRYKRCMNNNFEAMSNCTDPFLSRLAYQPADLETRLKLLGEAALADNELVAAGYLERPSQEPVICTYTLDAADRC